MKYLTIIRHAKSSWENPELDDFDRPLNERGKKAILLIGNFLKENNVKVMISLEGAEAEINEKKIDDVFKK